MSTALRNITFAPSSRRPTSKDTRVRVEAFAKMSAHVWPASGMDADLPRWRFTVALDARMISMSARDKFSRLKRCFMVERKRGV